MYREMCKILQISSVFLKPFRINKLDPLYLCRSNAVLSAAFYSSFKNYNSERRNYEILREDDVSFFRQMLDDSAVLTEISEVEKYNVDWLKSMKGSSSIVLRPKTTLEVSNILSYCYHRNLAVCPQGGNTGLVGGSVPIFDEIVLSMERMNKVSYFDHITGVLSCQAGCILEVLDNYVSDRQFVVPLDLAAKGSCQIGGNVSTNAGGLRLIRYGSLHSNILGLEIVLANGEILNCMNLMRKDNTGYDVKQLFIGSEGTLGVITQVAILCHPKPSATAVAFLGCQSFEKVMNASKIIKSQLSEVLLSLEMLDNYAAETVNENLHITLPIKSHPFYVLIEVSGSNFVHNEEKLSACLNCLMDQNLVEDGTMATESGRMKALWAMRERITEALLKEGHGYKYDVSLPLQDFYSIVEILREKLGNRVTRCCGYGHLGDGNMHFNATTKEFDPEVLSIIEPFIFEWTANKNGSISAEHGIGYKKKKYLHLNKTETAINLMKGIKQLFDPKGILNPYKIL